MRHSGGGRRTTVLVVDDDQAWIHLTCEAFASAAPHVVVESRPGGREALERLRNGPRPDLVLLDLNMPGYDGLDVLEALAGGPAQNVVVMSASLAVRSQEQVEALGARGYVTKPTTFRALEDLVADLAARLGEAAYPPR